MKFDIPLFACERKKLAELNGDLFVVAPLRRTRDGGPCIVPGYGLYFICDGPGGGRAARLLSNPMIRLPLKDVASGEFTYMTVPADKLVISLQEE